MTAPTSPPAQQAFVPPHPGSKRMPRWDGGPLVDPPTFIWRNWFSLVGPALLMAGAAIGGGEWLLGPVVTARYGGALMWLATLSILGQVVYNLEISRYTLYTGEPIFTGKFRTLPGPIFWLAVYAMLDFGALFPYLAANAAAPAAAMVLGHVVQSDQPWRVVTIFGNEYTLLQKHLQLMLAYAIFLLAFLPMIFGGKIYTALKVVMTFKVVAVLGFLLMLAICFTSLSTWTEILTGFVKVGTLPIERGEDLNGNGVLDPGEDWDGDGRLDVVEPMIDTDGDGKFDSFEDLDGDGIRDGDNVDNIFVALWEGRPLPDIDLSMIAYLAAFAAIAGQGGLNNVTISNYTRDQGWGMGHHVGAIPSVIGGKNISLSHVGMVFEITPESLSRWRRWYHHIVRDQLVIWAPACMLGIALPSMLSVAFLQRGTIADDWSAAAMTADGVAEKVGATWGASWEPLFWYLTLFCGFLVLAPTVAVAIDGFCRRWVDVFWTASRRLRKWDEKDIGKLYFGVLLVYLVIGLVVLSMPPTTLAKIATNIFNAALGFSCFHALAVNVFLLPKELRPHWIIRILMVLTGAFFLLLAALSFMKQVGWIS